MEAAGLGAGGVSDRIVNATQKTAQNTEKIAKLAADLGVTYSGSETCRACVRHRAFRQPHHCQRRQPFGRVQVRYQGHGR
jgi:hypothetical protein